MKDFTHQPPRAQHTAGGKNAPKIVTEPLPGGPDARGEKFREIEGQPTVKRSGESAHQYHGQQELPADNRRPFESSEEQGTRKERAGAQSDIGPAPSDLVAAHRAEKRPANGPRSDTDLRQVDAVLIVADFFNPEGDPLHRTPGAEQGNAPQQGPHQRAPTQWGSENIGEAVLEMG